MSVTCQTKLGTKEGQESPKTPKFGEAVCRGGKRYKARARVKFSRQRERQQQNTKYWRLEGCTDWGEEIWWKYRIGAQIPPCV